MNDKRRAKLRIVLESLSEAGRFIEAVLDQEQDSMDNYPENLQESERYTRMEDIVDALSDAQESISNAQENIEFAIE